jgi:protein gp37
MAENTKIEWAHHTFNPWIGCAKVSPGCDHCYAEADFSTRRTVVQWGAGQPRKRTAPSTWAQPLRWNAEAERLGVRYRVFCASLADVFDNEVPVQWRRDLLDLIEKEMRVAMVLTGAKSIAEITPDLLVKER